MCTPKPLWTPAHWRQRKRAKLTAGVRRARGGGAGIPEAHWGFGLLQSAQAGFCRARWWRSVFAGWWSAMGCVRRLISVEQRSRLGSGMSAAHTLFSLLLPPSRRQNLSYLIHSPHGTETTALLHRQNLQLLGSMVGPQVCCFTPPCLPGTPPHSLPDTTPSKSSNIPFVPGCAASVTRCVRPIFDHVLCLHHATPKDRRPLAPAAVAKMVVRREDNSIVEAEYVHPPLPVLSHSSPAASWTPPFFL